MIATLCAMTALIQTGQEFNWERANLDNGSAVIVQSLPNAKQISVQLFAAARGVQETPETHGMRHLLEHLLAKGVNKDLDRRIEAKGLFMTADTYRDAMQFEVRALPHQLRDAVDVLGEFLKEPKVTQEEIDKEAKILAQEFALQSSSTLLSSSAWTMGYGPAGLDPMGTLETLSKATPASIAQLYKKHYNPANLVISIAGPITAKEGIDLGQKLLAPLTGTPAIDWVRRPAGRSARGDAEMAKGSACGAFVSGYSEGETAWTIAAAFGVVTEFEDSFFLYTPSLQNGLVVVGSAKARDYISKIDSLSDAESMGLFRQGKINARAWLRNRLNTPSGAAYWRGYLGCQALGARPEYLLDNLDRLTPDQFRAGFENLKSGKAVEVVGGRL